MKLVRARALLALSLLVSGLVAENHTGKSYFAGIVPFQLAFPERVSMFHRDRQDMKACGWGGAIQVVPFYQRSRDADDIAKYFFPGNKTKLTAGEYNSDSVTNRSDDLLAHHFGIYTSPAAPGTDIAQANTFTFESQISMCPKETIGGVGLTWQQYLFCNLWFDLSTSIIQVKHELNFREKILDEGGTGSGLEGSFTSMSAALSSTRLNFGRFQTGCDQSMKNTGVADVEFRIAYDREICEGCCAGGVYLGAVFPTGTEPGKLDDDCDCSTSGTQTQTAVTQDWARYIWQPVVGNGRHWGIMFGTYGELELWRSCGGCTLDFFSDLNARYLFSRTQRRSFDLKGKPWGRYISAWDTGDDDAMFNDITEAKPLINFTTLCAKVRPGWSVDINNCLHFSANCFDIEIGYNAYYRESEKIDCPTGLATGVGLAHIYDSIEDDRTLTSSLQSIAHDNWSNGDDIINPLNGNDTVYVEVNTGDLDLASAAAPCVLQGTFYGALNYNWDNCCIPLFLGIGGSYSATADNAALDHWTIWGKIGFAF